MYTSIVFEHLHVLDQLALEASEAFRWTPVTVFFVLASSWWIKGPLFVAVAAVADLRSHHRLPFGTVFAAFSATTGAVVAAGLKQVVDRDRPALASPDADPLVTTPASPSFPSGHATTAFAAAALVGTFYPRSRIPVFVVAAVVACSRVYLGVHFWLDVIVGAALGTAIGVLAARTARRACRHV